MAIRFHCASCSQPIEVDDEWALKLVACPYCRKTVTAPAETQIDAAAPIPTATAPRDAHEIDSPADSPPASLRPVYAGGNGVAIAAFAMACILVACMGSIVVLWRVNATELKAQQDGMLEAMQEGKGLFESMQEASAKQMDETVSGGLLAASLIQVASFPLWIAALICGILGVRRSFRRTYAIMALCIVGLTPLVMCCGVMAVVA